MLNDLLCQTVAPSLRFVAGLRIWVMLVPNQHLRFPTQIKSVRRMG